MSWLSGGEDRPPGNQEHQLNVECFGTGHYLAFVKDSSRAAPRKFTPLAPANVLINGAMGKL